MRDVIAEYTRFELPFLWGSGHAAIADGTHIALLENNLLGAHHVLRYALGALPTITSVIRISPSLATSSRAGWGSRLYPGWLAEKSVRLAPRYAVCRYPWASRTGLWLSRAVGDYAYATDADLERCHLLSRGPCTTYTHIDALFTQVVDWDVIERHWRHDAGGPVHSSRHSPAVHVAPEAGRLQPAQRAV